MEMSTYGIGTLSTRFNKSETEADKDRSIYYLHGRFYDSLNWIDSLHSDD